MTVIRYLGAPTNCYP